MTFFWAFLLIQMLSYVVSSMTGGLYDFKLAAILSVIATVLIFVAAEVIPMKEHVEDHH